MFLAQVIRRKLLVTGRNSADDGGVILVFVNMNGFKVLPTVGLFAMWTTNFPSKHKDTPKIKLQRKPKHAIVDEMECVMLFMDDPRRKQNHEATLQMMCLRISTFTDQ